MLVRPTFIKETIVYLPVPFVWNSPSKLSAKSCEVINPAALVFWLPTPESLSLRELLFFCEEESSVVFKFKSKVTPFVFVLTGSSTSVK